MVFMSAVFVVISYTYWVCHHGTEEDMRKYKRMELPLLGIVFAAFIIQGFVWGELSF